MDHAIIKKSPDCLLYKSLTNWLLSQAVPAEGSTIDADQVVFNEAAIGNADGDDDADGDAEADGDEGEDGASSGDEKMLIIPGDPDGSAVGNESQLDGWRHLHPGASPSTTAAGSQHSFSVQRRLLPSAGWIEFWDLSCLSSIKWVQTTSDAIVHFFQNHHLF